MVAQEGANRILAAWVAGNAEGLKSEIEGVLRTRPATLPCATIEAEELELLESVASDLWISLAQPQTARSERLQSSFALLRHLSRRSEYLLKGRCAA